MVYATSPTSPVSKALSAAEAILAKAQKALNDGRLVVAYRLFGQAIALFESASDPQDSASKSKLAGIYENRSYSAYRLYYRKRRGSNKVWCVRGNECSQKCIDLHDQLFKWDKSEASFNEGYTQLLRLHRLGGELLTVGNFAEAEKVIRREIVLHEELADGDTPNSSLWLLSQQMLAESVLGLGDRERALGIINDALSFEAPAKENRSSTLKAYAELCTMKATLTK